MSRAAHGRIANVSEVLRHDLHPPHGWYAQWDNWRGPQVTRTCSDGQVVRATTPEIADLMRDQHEKALGR